MFLHWSYLEVMVSWQVYLSLFESFIWVFPKIGVPQNGWFIMENLIKMDDLGLPLFLETPILYQCFHPEKSHDHRPRVCVPIKTLPRHAAAALWPRVANRCLWSLGQQGNPLMMRFKALGVGAGEVVERKNYTPLTVDGRNPAGWWQDFFEENGMVFVEQCWTKHRKGQNHFETLNGSLHSSKTDIWSGQG